MARDATVLVVEDDEALQRLLQQTLRPRFTVLTASGWTQAHEIRSRTEIDLVVVDVNNLAGADRSGLDALCREADRTPVVLLASAGREAPVHARYSRAVPLRDLHRTLEEAVVSRRDGREAGRSLSAADDSNGILAESGAMRNVMA